MEEKKYLMQLKKISVEELKLVPHILVINENGNGSNGFILRLFNILKTKYGKSILRTELPFDTESTIEDFLMIYIRFFLIITHQNMKGF